MRIRAVIIVLTMWLAGCSEPLFIFPGGELGGEVTSPPAEWGEVPDTIQVETNPDDPYSINIWAAAIGADLYIATGEDGTKWSEHIDGDPRVRVRVDGSIYELVAASVDDPVERADVVDAYIRKYDIDREGSWVESGLIYRFDRQVELPRQLQWTTGDLAESFRAMDQYFPVRTISRGAEVSPLPVRTQRLDLEYAYEGETYSVQDFFDRTATTGLLILHKGEVIHEQYGRGANEESRFTSWSVAKSFTATLVGLAWEQRLIESLDDPVTKYLPELERTAYAGVSVRHALQMSSGVSFTEVYGEQEADVTIFLRDWIAKGKANEYLTTRLERAHSPGEKFNYNTSETQALGWIVHRVTGKTVSDYLSEMLWQPLGMEADGYWFLDRDGGMEATGMGINARLRDYARFGLAYMNGGHWNGKQVFSSEWVNEATTPSSDQVQPGNLYEGYPLGYQYQWWTFPNGTFEAQGVYGQFIFVDPENELVVVKTSAWPEAWVDEYEAEFYVFLETLQGGVGPR